MKLTNMLVLALTLSPASAFAEDAMAAMRAGQAAGSAAAADARRPNAAAAPLSPERFNMPDSTSNWIPVSFTEGGIRKSVFVRRPDVPGPFHWNSPVYTLTRQGTSNTYFARRVDYTLNYNWGVQFDWTVFPYWYTIHPHGIADQGIRATLDDAGGGLMLGSEEITVVPPTATGESADPALLVTAPPAGAAVTTDDGPAAPQAVAADSIEAPPALSADTAGAAPATDGSGAAPAADGSGAAPATDGSGAAPATDGSGAAPATDGSGAAPATDGSGAGPIDLTHPAEAPLAGADDHHEGAADSEGVHADVDAAAGRVQNALSGVANAFGAGDNPEAPAVGTSDATGAPTNILTPGESLRDSVAGVPGAVPATQGGASAAIVDPAGPSAEAMAAHNAERASRDRSNLIATAAFGVWGVAAGAMIFGTPLGAALMGLAMAGAIFGIGHFFGRGSGEGDGSAES